jgi:pentatricopeptide repeat protein
MLLRRGARTGPLTLFTLRAGGLLLPARPRSSRERSNDEGSSSDRSLLPASIRNADLFVTMMLKPMRSAAGDEQERLALLPRDHATFFAARARTLSNYMLLFRVHALYADGAGVLQSLAALKKERFFSPKDMGLVQYNHVLAAVARAGDEQAFAALRAEMVRVGVGHGDVYTYTCAATCLMRANKRIQALQLVREAKDAGVELTEVFYGALLSGYAEADDLVGATAVWEHMNTTAGLEPDTVLYTSMIHACAKGGKAEKALQLLSQMQKNGLMPTEVTFNAALHAAALRVDMWREAKQIFQQMKDSGLYVSEQTMNTLLLAASRIGDVKACRRIVRDMKDQNMNVSRLTLNTLINGHARAFRQTPPKDRPALIAAAERKYEQVVARPEGADLHTKLARLNVYAEGLYIKRAEEWFASIKDECIAQPQTALIAFTTMLKLYCHTVRPEQLQATLAEMKERQIVMDHVSYKWAIQGYTRAFWVRSAVQVVGQMVDQGLEPKGPQLLLLQQRCRQEDLRQQQHDLKMHLDRWKKGLEQRLLEKANEDKAMQMLLRGDELHRFLLPHPKVPLRPQTGAGHTRSLSQLI